MLGIQQRPISLDGMIIPPVAHDLRVMSIGFFLEQEGAIIWRGPMLHRALEQFLSDVHWGELDYLVVDMPPGTGDVGLSLGQLMPRAEARRRDDAPAGGAARRRARGRDGAEGRADARRRRREHVGLRLPLLRRAHGALRRGRRRPSRRAARRPAARRGAARAGAARGLRRRTSAAALGAREPRGARDHGHRRAARRACGRPGRCASRRRSRSSRASPPARGSGEYPFRGTRLRRSCDRYPEDASRRAPGTRTDAGARPGACRSRRRARSDGRDRAARAARGLRAARRRPPPDRGRPRRRQDDARTRRRPRDRRPRRAHPVHGRSRRPRTSSGA